MSKIIFITNNQEELLKMQKVAQDNQCEFKSYTEEEWATFDDLETHIQDEDFTKKIVPLPTGRSPVFSLDEVEAEIIKKVINDADGNAVKASKVLKIGRATLYRKIDKYGLDLKQIREDLKQVKKDAEKIQHLHVLKKAS